MEPERKIEKLLRSYAKKRRADAGDPLTLHPATRRLLQGEVARNAARPGKESVPLWKLLRQRWAFVSGFALVVLFGVALLLPIFNDTKSKAQKVVAMHNLKQDSEPTNYGRPELIAANDVPIRQPSETPLILKKAEGNAVAAPTIAGPSKPEADWPDAKLADGGSPATTSGVLAANAPAAAPVMDSLAKAPVGVANDFKTKANAVQLTTATAQNYNFSAQNSFKNTIAPAKATAVLANFQVQQNGSAIRVVDADGSVYDGALQPESVVAQNEPVPAAAPAAALDASKEVERQKISAPRRVTQSAQNYFFRVTGTNLTLKQNVVFAGNLLANSGMPANTQRSLNGAFAGGPLQSALTNQLPWSDSRIVGTAVVDDTNSIEVNAVPQSP